MQSAAFASNDGRLSGFDRDILDTKCLQIHEIRPGECENFAAREEVLWFF